MERREKRNEMRTCSETARDGGIGRLYKPVKTRSNMLIRSSLFSKQDQSKFKMKSAVASLASLVSLGQCLSLPPLIPSIPGVTDVLTKNAPPLPILQIPTPPLESPPFTPSDIKPKKIGYFWTGSGDKQHKGMCLHFITRIS